MAEQSRLPSLMWVCLIQSVEGLTRTKSLIIPRGTGISTFSCLWTLTETPVFLGFEPVGLRLELHHWFSWFLGFLTWGVTTPLALLGILLANSTIDNCVSHFLKINKVFISVLLVLFLWRTPAQGQRNTSE